MNEFIASILETLQKNGFPQKKVSLPTEKMFEAADKRGFSFNKVLDQLKAEHDIESTIGPDKIVFSKTQKSPQDMMKEAQEMMAKMSPEELRKIQEMFSNLTPEEKEEMMEKAKDLGLA